MLHYCGCIHQQIPYGDGQALQGWQPGLACLVRAVSVTTASVQAARAGQNERKLSLLVQAAAALGDHMCATPGQMQQPAASLLHLVNAQSAAQYFSFALVCGLPYCLLLLFKCAASDLLCICWCIYVNLI